jgi:hypothetical protein
MPGLSRRPLTRERRLCALIRRPRRKAARFQPAGADSLLFPATTSREFSATLGKQFTKSERYGFRLAAKFAGTGLFPKKLPDTRDFLPEQRTGLQGLRPPPSLIFSFYKTGT